MFKVLHFSVRHRLKLKLQQPFFSSFFGRPEKKVKLVVAFTFHHRKSKQINAWLLRHMDTLVQPAGYLEKVGTLPLTLSVSLAQTSISFAYFGNAVRHYLWRAVLFSGHSSCSFAQRYSDV